MNIIINYPIEFLLSLYAIITIYTGFYKPYFQVQKVTEENLMDKYIILVKRRKK